MASFKSKILYRLLMITRYKKWWPKNESNIAIARRIDRQRPPNYFYIRYKIEEKDVGKGKMFSILPHETNSNKHILYLPGGGYVRGPLKQHWTYLHKLIGITGVAATMLEYPKTPEHNYTDAYNAVWYAYTEIVKTNIATDIIFMGDSAGGALALGLAQMLRQKEMPQPEQLILLFPWMDASLTDPDIKKFEEVEPMLDREALQKIAGWYAAGEDMKNPLLSPLYADLGSIAPITIIAGTYDILWTDIWRFWDRAKTKKHAVELINFDKMIHGFTHTSIPEAKKAMDIVAGKIVPGA